MLYYDIDISSLYGLVDYEVSMAADQAYSQDGASLYDSIVLTEKDRPAVNAYIGDAIRSLSERLFDICRFVPDTAGDGQIQFYVPDFDEKFEGAVDEEITRYIVLSVSARIFQERRVERLQDYDTRAAASLEKAVKMLKSRKSPVEPWS